MSLEACFMFHGFYCLFILSTQQRNCVRPPFCSINLTQRLYLHDPVTSKRPQSPSYGDSFLEFDFWGDTSNLKLPPSSFPPSMSWYGIRNLFTDKETGSHYTNTMWSLFFSSSRNKSSKKLYWTIRIKIRILILFINKFRELSFLNAEDCRYWVLFYII